MEQPELGPDDKIDPIGRTPLYRQLAAIVRARIKRGDWEVGSRIPSEAGLEQEYGLSRITVRNAVKVLVEEGLVVVAPARGTFVVRVPE